MQKQVLGCGRVWGLVFSVPCYWLVECDFWSVKDPSVTQFSSLSNQDFSCIISGDLQGSETIHTGCVGQSWYMLSLGELVVGPATQGGCPGHCVPHSVTWGGAAL